MPKLVNFALMEEEFPIIPVVSKDKIARLLAVAMATRWAYRSKRRNASLLGHLARSCLVGNKRTQVTSVVVAK